MNNCPYICGPLTELTPKQQSVVKDTYSALGDVTAEFGPRAFVPHEHHDPVKHANFTPADVDKAERHQVCELTSLLIVVAIAPSWGGGIEVEMAHNHQVPVIILCQRSQLEARKVSRLLRGSPAVREVLCYEELSDAPDLLRQFMSQP